MAINDVISAVLTKFGLKQTEAQKCEAAIGELEEKIRNLYDQLNERIDESKRLEARISKLKAQYDIANSATRQLLEDQIRSLLRECKHIKERQGLLLRNIEREKAMKHACELKLDNLRNPTDVDAVGEMAEDKREMVEDLKEEDKALAELAGIKYEREARQDESIIDNPAANKAREEALNREIEALFGASKKVKPEAPVSETPSEIA